jgi:putative DNA primase/helicase
MNPLLESAEICDVPEVDAHAHVDSALNNHHEADDRTIADLATLPLLEYERQREKAAEKLRCRTSILDRLVDGKRLKNTDLGLQGNSVNFPKVEPWPEPVDGAEMLNRISQVFSRYIVLPEGAANVLALWCAHTHVFKAFICSPRLNISSPDKRCGKTTLRDVAALFVSRAVLTENLSVAVLFRLVDAHAPTILADEYDAWLRNNEELRGLLNAGHRHGAAVYRCEGEGNEVRAFSAYSPAVLCGIGALPGTLHDRSITIRLERAKPGEVPELFDPRRTEREQELCQKLIRWCADNFARFKSADPVLPNDMFNRLADNWRPLFAVAEVAGSDWPECLLAAVNTLLKGNNEEDESVGMRTLSAIKNIFNSSNTDRLPTKDILQGLVANEDGPWARWWEHELKNENTKGPAAKLAHLLKSFGINPRGIRISDETTLRGYMIEDFAEAWKRYCLPKPA